MLDQIEPLIERGQKQGVFRSDLPVVWHLAVVRAIVHAASAAIQGGRIAESEAEAAMLTTAINAIATPVSERALAASHLVDADGCGEDERGVLSGGDLDPVGVAYPEPPLRRLRDLVPVALDLVLVVDDVALGGQLAAVLQLDREAVTERADERLLDRGDSLAPRSISILSRIESFFSWIL